MKIGRKGSWVLDTETMILMITQTEGTIWEQINHVLYILRLNKFWARSESNYVIVNDRIRIKLTAFEGDLDALPMEYKL